MSSPRQFVRTFEPRFAWMVEAGIKRQTIRNLPSRIPLPGDLFSARAWTGVAYRSPQRILRVSPIIYVVSVRIGAGHCFCAGLPVTDLDGFAKADGFCGWVDLRSYFMQRHDLVAEDYEGILIRW